MTIFLQVTMHNSSLQLLVYEVVHVWLQFYYSKDSMLWSLAAQYLGREFYLWETHIALGSFLVANLRLMAKYQKGSTHPLQGRSSKRCGPLFPQIRKYHNQYMSGLFYPKVWFWWGECLYRLAKWNFKSCLGILASRWKPSMVLEGFQLFGYMICTLHKKNSIWSCSPYNGIGKRGPN